MEQSVFTKIYKGELPSHIVYKDDICFAILDIFPVAPGHLLLISNEQYEQLEDLPTDVLTHMFVVAQKLRPKIRKAMGADYVIISVVGTDVPHFHIQFIPRKKDDGLSTWQPGTLDPQVGQEIAAKYKEYLS